MGVAKRGVSNSPEEKRGRRIKIEYPNRKDQKEKKRWGNNAIYEKRTEETKAQ